MQTHMTLVRSSAGDVTTDAADDRDATQPAFITWRRVWRELTPGHRQIRTTQCSLDHRALLLLKPGPFHRCPDP